MAAAELLNRNLSRNGASSARHRALSKSKISGASLCSAKFLFLGCLGENLHHWPSVQQYAHLQNVDVWHTHDACHCVQSTWLMWPLVECKNFEGVDDLSTSRGQQSCCVLYDLWSSFYQSVFCIICLLCQHFCDIGNSKKNWCVTFLLHKHPRAKRGHWWAHTNSCMQCMQCSPQTAPMENPLNTQTWRVAPPGRENLWLFYWRNRVFHTV